MTNIQLNTKDNALKYHPLAWELLAKIDLYTASTIQLKKIFGCKEGYSPPIWAINALDTLVSMRYCKRNDDGSVSVTQKGKELLRNNPFEFKL